MRYYLSFYEGQLHSINGINFDYQTVVHFDAHSYLAARMYATTLFGNRWYQLLTAEQFQLTGNIKLKIIDMNSYFNSKDEEDI